MDFRKIDAPLAAALEDAGSTDERVLDVFVHTKPLSGSEPLELLHRLNTHGRPDQRQVFTAALSPSEIAQLSDQPWVDYLRLSRPLRSLESR